VFVMKQSLRTLLSVATIWAILLTAQYALAGSSPP
jgi:hypothetical protein